MDVEIIPEANQELRDLPSPERKAMARAVEKLQLLGTHLAYPHSSQVQGTGMRELRPRAGRSPWRALYQRVGDRMVIIAIAPEAQHDPRGFKRAVAQAQRRLTHIQNDS